LRIQHSQVDILITRHCTMTYSFWIA
jgi:hypothetical protein